MVKTVREETGKGIPYTGCEKARSILGGAALQGCDSSFVLMSGFSG
jgi:hypothetical protein